MKNVTKTISRLVIISLALIFLLAACQDNDKPFHKEKGQVQFRMRIKPLPMQITPQVSSNSNKNEKNLDEDAQDKNPTQLTVSIAIKNTDSTVGEKIYENKTLTYEGSTSISEKLSLKPGEYYLTDFSAQNGSAQTIYFSPLKDSEFIKYVKDPLPLTFTINEKETTVIRPEVIGYNKSLPNYKFGYFKVNPFIIVEMTTFNLVVFDEKDQVTNFHLKVSSTKRIDESSAVKEVVFINKDIEANTYGVRVPNTYSEFDIEISKQDFKTQTFHKTLTELKEMIYPKGFFMVYLKSTKS